MATNKFSGHYISRYTDYLNDVVKYYNKNHTLRGFSKVTKNHRITKITTEQFFLHKLHLWGDEPLTTEKVIEVLKGITGKDFSSSAFVRWEHENGSRSIGYIENGVLNQTFIINDDGALDKEENMWCYCDIDTQNLKFLPATKEDVELFASKLFSAAEDALDELNYIKHELYKRNIKIDFNPCL
jgi:hypothetical protein